MTETIETSKARERAADRGDQAERGHLTGVEVGAGCTEIWEHLSDGRADGD